MLRWPLPGFFIAILGDLGDLFLLHFIGQDWSYQTLDKWFDLFYMVAFLIVVLRWPQPVKGVALALFLFRMVGFTAFEVTHWRPILIFFPNVFEFWFLAVILLQRWRPAYLFTMPGIVVWLALLTIAKLGQEYALHVGKWFDGFTIMDFLGGTWRILTP